MRRKFALLNLVALLLLAAAAVLWPIGTVQCVEQDFDDGIVEEVQEDGDEELLYESPKYDPERFYFVEHFDDIAESQNRWIKSDAKKDDIAEEISKYDGTWNWEAPQRIVWKNDIGLVLKSKAKHAAIASRFKKPFTFKDNKPLVVQYEVTLQDGQECGGSYIKLLSAGKNNEDLSKFNDKTPYTIMFGPDKCGNDHKLHFIFRHVNPINGSITEKHCRKPKDRLEEPFKDKLPHLYQLILRPDNTFEISIDHKVVQEGSLLSEFTPPVNPPREIDDPDDKKPTDWDDREKIPDPTAQKPEDWDETEPPQIPDPNAVKPDGWLDDEPDMVPDPTAQKPEDWDSEIDGDWEAPLVDNPLCEQAPGCGVWKAPLVPNKAYVGKWRAPLIDNPNYQGKWAPRKIPNPDFFEDLTPFKMTPISAIGIELWSMSSDILFDNIVITDELFVARDFAAQTFDLKRKYIDKESDSFVKRISNYANDNPLVWKIALVLVVVPVSYFLYRLIGKGGSQETADADAAKKTDAPTADDITKTTTGDVLNDVQKPSHKSKKSDLDVKDDDVLDKAKKLEEDEQVAEQSTEEGEGEEEEEDEQEEPEKTTEATVGARKRNVRRD